MLEVNIQYCCQAVTGVADQPSSVMLSILASRGILTIGGMILAMGSAGIAININSQTMSQKLGIDLSLLDAPVVLHSAIALAALGLLWCMLCLSAVVVDAFFLTASKSVIQKFERIKGRVDCLSLHSCSMDDIQVITEIARKEFGSLSASLDRNNWLYSIDPEAYLKVVDDKKGVVGFYDIFRLSKLGTSAASRGELDITTCPRGYLRTDKRKYTNIYIGGIYGKNNLAKAMILGAINKHIDDIRPRIVYARAASVPGLRLLEQQQFEPVSQKSGLGAIYRKKGISS